MSPTAADPRCPPVPEVGGMPHDMELPAMGAKVAGTVIWRADHNHQVKIKLDEWDRPA